MATSSDRLSKIILRYEVDRASVQEAADSAKDISASLNEVATAAANLVAVAKQLDFALSPVAKNAALDKLASEMALAVREGEALDDVIKRATADLIRLDAKAGDVNRVAGRFTGEVSGSQQADERKAADDARERIREAQQLSRLLAEADEAKAARLAAFTRQEAQAHQERLKFLAAARNGPLSDPVAVQNRLLDTQLASARATQLDKLAQRYARMAVEGKDAAVVTRELSADLARLGATADEVDRVAHAFDRAEKEARALAAAEDELLNKRLDAIGTPGGTRKLDQRSLFQGGRLQGGALGRLGSELRLLPSVQIPGANIGTDQVANLIRIGGAANTVLAGTGVSLASVGAAGLVAGAALTPLIIALNQYSKELERVEAETKRRVETEIEVRRQLQDATTEDLQARRGAAVAKADFERQFAENTARASFDAFNSLSDVDKELAALGQDVSEPIRNFRALSDAAAEQAVKSQVAQIELDTLNQLLGENAGAANDFSEALGIVRDALVEVGLIAEQKSLGDLAEGLAEVITFIPQFADAAQRAFAEATTKTNLDNAAQVGDDFTTLSNALNGSSDSARDLVDRLEQEAEAARLSAAALEASGDTSSDVTEQIKAYNAEAEKSADLAGRLLNIIIPSIEAREREVEIIERQIAAIDRRVALEVQAFNVLQTGTVESVDARIAALNAEAQAVSQSIPGLQALARTNTDYQAQVDAANDRLTALNLELNVLATLRPDVAARQFREESEKLALSLVKDIQRIEAARDSRIAEIEANLGNKEAELARQRSDAVTDAEEKAAAKRIDALEDFREAEARINRKFNKDYLTAVGNRDALAAFEAKLQREEDLQEAEAKLAQQEAAIDKSLREQQKTIEKRYADQLQTARDNARRAIQLERDKATAEINLKVQAYNAEIANLRANLFAQNALMQQFWAANIAIANRAVAQVVAQMDAQSRQIVVPQTTLQLSGGSPTERFNAYQRNQGVQGFASGLWDVPYDNMLARLHRGEMVVPQRQAQVIRENRQMGGVNVSVVINGRGLSDRQIVQKVDQRLYETFRQDRRGR